MTINNFILFLDLTHLKIAISIFVQSITLDKI